MAWKKKKKHLITKHAEILNNINQSCFNYILALPGSEESLQGLKEDVGNQVVSKH